MTVAIGDYGAGNLRSAAKAFERAVAEAGLDMGVVVPADPGTVRDASHVVLPGVGAFADCKRGVEALPGMRSALEEAVIRRGVPFLGICVGLQLMFSESEERGQHRGLDLLPGRVRQFPATERVPQIGWNQIAIQRPCAILEEIPEGSFYYFVHSYYVEPARPADSVATTDYGLEYPSIAPRDQVFGVQFHPEKRQDFGLKILDNFANLN